MKPTPFIAVDIETVPTIAALKEPYPEQDRQPPANYKSPEAIAKWRAEDELKWAAQRGKECSLNPRLGRIVAIGLQTDALLDTEPTVLLAQREEDEREMLREFWRRIAINPLTRLVTWNGEFDLRFIVVRSIALDVVPPLGGAAIREWFSRYTNTHHDCKAILLRGSGQYGYVAGEGLDEWARFFGFEGKSGHGSEVFQKYTDGDFPGIATYCADDVRLTACIYAEKIAPFFGD